MDKSPSHPSPDCPRAKTDGALSAGTGDAAGKSRSLPREGVVVREQIPRPGTRLTTAEKNRCASMDEILTHSETRMKTAAVAAAAAPVSLLQQLIGQKLERTEQLLMEVQREAEGEESTEGARAKAERLLKEAAAVWNQAREVLEEVKELRALYRQLDGEPSVSILVRHC